MIMEQIDYDERVRTPQGDQVQRVRETHGWLSPARVIGFVLGVALFVTGAVVVVRCGIDSTLNTPLTTIFGITHSASIGIIELVAGLLLVACATAEDLRPVIGIIGALAIVAGVLGLAAGVTIQQQVGFANDTAKLFIGWGVIALVAALLPSSWQSHRRVQVTPPVDRV
jgi:hypothetical protein